MFFIREFCIDMEIISESLSISSYSNIDLTTFQENYPHSLVKNIPPIEQVGTFDPIPNEHGEKLCSLNLERIAFYVGKGIKISEDVSLLLGKK